MNAGFEKNKANVRYVLMISFCAWLTIFMTKMIFSSPIKELSSPLAIFWIATGVACSVPCFGIFTGIKSTPSHILSLTKSSISILMLSAICGALAYGCFLFIEGFIPVSGRISFFILAPLIFWAVSSLYFSQKRSYPLLIGVTIIALGIGISLYPIGSMSIANLSSLFLGSFVFLAFLAANKDKASSIAIVLLISLISVIFSSFFLISNWSPENIQLEHIYPCAVGGVLLGLSILAFLEAVSFADEKQAVLLILPCFLTFLFPDISGVVKGALPFLLAAILIFPACNLIRAIHTEKKQPSTR